MEIMDLVAFICLCLCLIGGGGDLQRILHCSWSYILKGVVIIYGRGAVEKGGGIEFECKQLERGAKFQCPASEEGGKL